MTVLEWSNAGHPPPLLVSPDGEVRLLEAADTDLLREAAARAARTSGSLEELVDAVLAGMLPAPSSDDVAVVAVGLRRPPTP